MGGLHCLETLGTQVPQMRIRKKEWPPQAPVAQWIELLVSTQSVGGSSPSGRTLVREDSTSPSKMTSDRHAARQLMICPVASARSTARRSLHSRKASALSRGHSSTSRTTPMVRHCDTSELDCQGTSCRPRSALPRRRRLGRPRRRVEHQPRPPHRPGCRGRRGPHPALGSRSHPWSQTWRHP